MSPTSLRRYRDKFLFALAYGAVIGAVLFAHPFKQDVPAQSVANATETVR
ncbi:hypothetical protein ACO2RV_02430 [Ancylobacter sp. VNQ12]